MTGIAVGRFTVGRPNFTKLCIHNGNLFLQIYVQKCLLDHLNPRYITKNQAVYLNMLFLSDGDTGFNAL
jgi:hypothetical protein